MEFISEMLEMHQTILALKHMSQCSQGSLLALLVCRGGFYSLDQTGRNDLETLFIYLNVKK